VTSIARISRRKFIAEISHYDGNGGGRLGNGSNAAAVPKQ